MNTQKEFMRIMKEQNEIALATSIENKPNVRIVNFYYDEVGNVLYFSTFNDNQKINEFMANSQIAITTIPHNGIEHVKAHGIVSKSNKTVYDLRDEFVNKIDGYDENIEQAGAFLELFELRLIEVVVTLDFENIGSFSL